MREQIQREQLQHHQQGMEAKLSALSGLGLNNCRTDKVSHSATLCPGFLSRLHMSIVVCLLRAYSDRSDSYHLWAWPD